MNVTVNARSLQEPPPSAEIAVPRGRGWLVLRMLLLADVLALALAFVVAQLLFGLEATADNHIHLTGEFVLFFLTLPVWVVVSKLYGLYDNDETRTGHTTVDDLVGVFHLVTVGVWLFLATAWLTGLVGTNWPKVMTFWILAIILVTLGRAFARFLCRRRNCFVQNAVIVGAGEVGQLVARKFLQHPEYGVNLVGFVDHEPKERRGQLEHLPVIGSVEKLPELVNRLNVQRVVIAFWKTSHVETLELIRSLKRLNVYVDIVPRLYEVVGPNVGMHTVEGLPLIGLPAAKPFPFSRWIKRSIDVLGAVAGLVATAPVFAFIACRIMLESGRPVFFRQTRLGKGMNEFTLLKFRTMVVGTDDAEHREHIKMTMSAAAALSANGLYKLERGNAVTPFGRWLRRTSLDELPQLINVLRGDMSLVGPRPCIPYETEQFAPHHFERFLVPAGLTGLWQVTARAHATFGEALDMDVAYARGWSLALDLRLLCRTPVEMLRRTGTA
jgi:exopolysaccharide biosynthesis polyprenyl glycosylphosphotransferase